MAFSLGTMGQVASNDESYPNAEPPPMIVRVLLFGPAADAAAAPHAEVELPAESTVGALRQAVVEAYPKLEPFVRHGRFACNTRYVPDDQRIAPDDEIALIAMVSGG